MTERHVICDVSEVPAGESTIVEVDGLSVGIFNIEGEFFALNNVCPHQLAPLCEGEVTGTVTASKPGEYVWEREGRVIRCPWHHWEFDIRTDASVFNPHVGTRTFDVAVESHEYGAPLSGEAPPIDTYDVAVEEEVVVLYL